MGGAVIGALRVNLGLNSAQFQDGLKRSRRSSERFTKAISTGLTRALAASSVALAGLGAVIVTTTRNLAELSAQAKTAGIAFEEFQRLKYVAEQNLIGVDALTDGLKEMNLRADEFVLTGGGSSAEAFKRLGYSADELKEKLSAPSALFSEIIGKLEGLDRAAQIRIADEIFGGTGGEQFVRLLGEGADGIERLKNEADKLGIVVSAKTAVASEKFSASMKRMQGILGNIAVKITEAVLPTVNALMETLSSPAFAAAMQDFAVMAVNVANGIAQAFIVAHQAFKDFMAYVNPQVAQDSRSTREIYPMAYGNALGDLHNQLNNRSRGLGTTFALEGFDFSSFQTFYDNAGLSSGGGGSSGGSSGGGLGSAISAANDNAIELVDGLDKVKSAAQEMAETLAGAFHGIGSEIMGIITGTGTMGDKLTGVLNAVLDRVGALGYKLIDMAPDQMITNLFSNFIGAFAGGGLPGSNLSVLGMPLYSQGGYTGSGALGSVAGLVHGQEYVLNAAATNRIGRANLDAMNAGVPVAANGNGPGGGTINVAISVSVDESGNLVPLITGVSGKVAGQVVAPVAQAVGQMAAQGTRG